MEVIKREVVSCFKTMHFSSLVCVMLVSCDFIESVPSDLLGSVIVETAKIVLQEGKKSYYSFHTEVSAHILIKWDLASILHHPP